MCSSDLIGIIAIVWVLVVGMLDKKDKHSIKVINGVKYRWLSVETDWEKVRQDEAKVAVGEMTIDEHKRKFNRGDYGIHAWVKVGEPPHSWVDDPINEPTVLGRNISPLPQYIKNKLKQKEERGEQV